MQISKQQVTQYQIRFPDRSSWADITIEPNGTQGRIAIISDYGSWNYYWGACGVPFVQFLLDLKKDPHYFANKVGEANYTDVEKTIVAMKQQILSARRDESITAEVAREMYLELTDAIHDDAFQLIDRVYNDYELSKFFFDGVPTVTDISPSFRQFFERIYTPFCDHLQQEL